MTLSDSIKILRLAAVLFETYGAWTLSASVLSWWGTGQNLRELSADMTYVFALAIEQSLATIAWAVVLFRSSRWWSARICAGVEPALARPA